MARASSLKKAPKIHTATSEKYSEFLRDILSQRGITGEHEINKFLHPDYDHDRHDPFLLDDMARVVDRLCTAFENEECIGIFSDYDADGIPGAVMFQDFLTRIKHENFHVYIPHRHDEGYGLNCDAIDTLHEKGVTLLITIDCGIRDHEVVTYAQEKGIDVIVTDHHEPAETLPDAYAIVNPKKKTCEYPFKGLCGTGVAFKVIEGVLLKDRRGLALGHEKWLLDMVGLATLSDMVPLVDENRVFARYGLEVLRKTQRPGLKELYRTLRLPKDNLSEDDISFMITPRINAASRMAHPEDAFLVLSSRQGDEAKVGVAHLEKINNERKGLVASIVKEAYKRLRRQEVDTVIVMGDPSWKPAVLGLVAGKLAEEYDVPTFIWGRENGDVIKGSCRTGGGVNMVKLMEQLGDSFIDFGGHTEAGGFSLSHESLFDLEEKMKTTIASMKKDVSQAFHVVDRVLTIDEVEEELVHDLKKLAPFGIENPKPLFLLQKIQPISLRTFGKEKNHLEVVFQKTDGERVKGIYFFVTDEILLKLKGGREAIDLHVHIEESFWNGRREVRLRIVDVMS